jgi:hypothetical protein
VRQQNLTLIGETADLHEFLFGSERNSLAMVRPVLLDISTVNASTAIAGSLGTHPTAPDPGSTWRLALASAS